MCNWVRNHIERSDFETLREEVSDILKTVPNTPLALPHQQIIEYVINEDYNLKSFDEQFRNYLKH